MKQIRKHASKIATVLSLSLLFISCSKEAVTSEINEKLNQSMISRVSDMDGVTLFKGIFFFQGDLANNINALKYENEHINSLKNGKQIKQVLNNFSDEAINFILKIDSNYFENFKSVIYSGNNFEIQKVLSNSAKLIELAGKSSEVYGSYFNIAEEVSNDELIKEKISKIDLNTIEGQEELKNLLDISSENNANKEMIPCTPGAVFCVYYLAALAVSYAIAAYTAIAAANVLVYAGAWVYSLTENSTEIETESLVADISNYFNNNN